ncbi:TetR/AcrR family transcriptional regulator C-terminal domain-containing protein [Arthrobacter russicus]|uniref:Transcriptional regulator TetR C-terminal Proteobacteria type domain-containing protein n=1 Tax=Arthrobacter russicus TaxID=172040 RepID=A0ABU1J8W8_9MICC|nr:TetR/AcrR family transcriptional regulator C-terminal domain-containing protein [Arthrobacter russicus]MDR6268872.1 hypothetical protein [Arthrobacter russicus]
MIPTSDSRSVETLSRNFAIPSTGSASTSYRLLHACSPAPTLFRIVIAELPRFPELGEAHFGHSKMPYFDSVRRYLDTENALGTTKLDDTEMAAAQFLGMISNYVFWPRMLLMNWSPRRRINSTRGRRSGTDDRSQIWRGE